MTPVFLNWRIAKASIASQVIGNEDTNEPYCQGSVIWPQCSGIGG